jgi:hypothetical protein
MAAGDEARGAAGGETGAGTEIGLCEVTTGLSVHELNCEERRSSWSEKDDPFMVRKVVDGAFCGSSETQGWKRS